jgi:hypothetical protein
MIHLLEMSKLLKRSILNVEYTSYKRTFLKDNKTLTIQIHESRFNRQQDWEDLYDHIMSTRVFTLIMNKVFVKAPNSMRQNLKIFILSIS